MPNILDIGYRASAIKEIKGEENRRRKEESLRRFEIYRERQRPFILKRLEEEFSNQTVREMRTITSINLCKRIVDDQASIYKKVPERSFTNASEQQEAQLEALYKHACADIKLKLSNKGYKLEQQCAIQVVPKNGVIAARVLLPHHYDVIPYSDDPESAEVYIINVVDKYPMFNEIAYQGDSLASAPTGSRYRNYDDNINQRIGDQDDYKALLERYVWWSKEFNFMTNGKGQVISPMTNQPLDVFDPMMFVNPIQKLPFIDIAGSKDFEFWVRYGNNVVDFAIDFGVLLSDTANINRLQGYSQAVITSVDAPKNMQVGPHAVIHLPLDPNAPELKPTFEFQTPSPDMSASLDLLDRYLTMFLTSNGIDPKMISGRGDGQSYKSGFERLLAMMDKFEASQDDIDLYYKVEQELFELLKIWSNTLQSTDLLIPELQQAMISDDISMDVKFCPPNMLQTKQENEDSIIKLMNAGLMSRLEAVMHLREVSEEKAEEIVEKIDQYDLMTMKPPANEVVQNGNSEEDAIEEQPQDNYQS